MGGVDSQAGAVTVLVVDDEPGMADLVATYLERVDGGLDATGVTDPRAGLERLHRERYDAVVSDYHMPSMDGLAFLDRVADVAPAATRILLTSDDAKWLIRAAREADVEFVHKRMRRERFERIASHVRGPRTGGANGRTADGSRPSSPGRKQ